MDELPTIDELAEPVPKDRICLTIDEGDWRAICAPNTEKRRDTYEQMGATVPTKYHDAPFAFAYVGDAPSEDEIGTRFHDKFDQKVTEVYELISDVDDPLESILDLDPDNLVGPGSADRED